MSRKRPRVSNVIRAARRPIDKNLVVTKLQLTTAAATTTLKTITFPGTMTGLRWVLNFRSNSAAASPVGSWVIVLVPEGDSINAISQTDGATMYNPEQNVLAFGVIAVADTDGTTGPRIMKVEGSTKTMRKLKSGDKLQLGTLSDTVTSINMDGVVQFFMKT